MEEEQGSAPVFAMTLPHKMEGRSAQDQVKKKKLVMRILVLVSIRCTGIIGHNPPTYKQYPHVCGTSVCVGGGGGGRVVDGAPSGFHCVQI